MSTLIFDRHLVLSFSGNHGDTKKILLFQNHCLISTKQYTWLEVDNCKTVGANEINLDCKMHKRPNNRHRDYLVNEHKIGPAAIYLLVKCVTVSSVYTG